MSFLVPGGAVGHPAGVGHRGQRHAARPRPAPAWPANVAALPDAGTSTGGIALSPRQPEPPSPEVAALLRARGIPERSQHNDGRLSRPVRHAALRSSLTP